jgi:ABC-type Fe3+/spermidine/putrescine transport system ATPase subunit
VPAGPNGVGKSTTLKGVMGLVVPTGVAVTFKGRPIAGWPPHRIARLGLGDVPEERRIFPTITVKENLLMAGPAGAAPCDRTRPPHATTVSHPLTPRTGVGDRDERVDPSVVAPSGPARGGAGGSDRSRTGGAAS